MTSIEFHLRSSLRNRRSKGSVFVRVIHSRKACCVTMPWRLYPEEWDKKRHEVVYGGHPSPMRIQQLCKISQEMQLMRQYFEEIVNRLEWEQGVFLATDIVAVYRRSQGRLYLRDYVEKLCGELQSMGKERTARAYRTTTRRLLSFFGNEKLELKQLNSLLIRRFEHLLYSEKRSLNTISFYMRNLRAIYNKAVREGLLERSFHNPFEGVYTRISPTRKRALSREDMQILNNKASARLLLNIPSPDNYSKEVYDALLLFMFCFHARGMSFIDLAFLKKEDIRGNRFTYQRKKTGQFFEVKMTCEMRKIIKWFASRTVRSRYVFPIIKFPGVRERHQYESGLSIQNRRLKKLGQLSGISGTLSTHVARHSWATIAKKEKVPLTVISESLGHSSEKTTAIYLASFDSSVLDEAGKRVARAIKSTG